ncbi:BQ2448_1784 [Microbotryum intermedium]|uniref:BQ2448_1784 protein n=1 Tax=Microbotryum intermedium TaxID=269621 RepID=A0A238F974_9BASI|nr:BQ2448_1784 [Microbotryum intermedium]
MELDAILRKDFFSHASPIRSSFGYECRYCYSGRLRRSHALKHAASYKHHARTAALDDGHTTPSNPASLALFFPDSTDDQFMDNAEHKEEHFAWEPDMCPTPRKIPPLAKIFVATPFLTTHRQASPIFAEALIRFNVLERAVWNSDQQYRTTALSLISSALSTARSDLHKLTILKCVQIWYKGQPMTFTEDHVAWWSVLRLAEDTNKKKDPAPSFWDGVADVAKTLATKAAEKYDSQRSTAFYRRRIISKRPADCSNSFLWRTVVAKFYPDDAAPKTTISTTDGCFQACCTSGIRSYDPPADFHRLVLTQKEKLKEGDSMMNDQG